MSMQYNGAPQILPFGKGAMEPDTADFPNLPDTPDLSSGQTMGTPTKGGGMVDFGGLVESFRTVTPALDAAGKSEKAFLSGHGNLLEMVLERAKADTLLSLTAATASKVTQAASTLMNLQV